MTQAADDARAARDIRDAVDRCWAAMVDLTPDQKDMVIGKLCEMLAMEVLSHEPAHALEKRH
jgi:hypothetical protein